MRPIDGTRIADLSNIAIRPEGQGLNAGAVVNRLTVQGWQFRINRNWRVVALCDCGNLCTPRVQDLVAGKMISCNCHKSALGSERGRRMWTTHGGRNTRLYGIWRGMRRRCYEPEIESYQHYGARGITVCEEWRCSFEAFRSWALSHGYKQWLSIDRINNDGNYEPSNCRWATNSEQGNNTRRTRMLTYQGRTQCLMAWAEETGVGYLCLKGRLRSGWTIERALTTPPKAQLPGRRAIAVTAPSARE